MPRPELTRAARPSTVSIAATNERGERAATPIAAEYALTIYLDKREIVTLMTMAAAPEALVLGYLRNQRLIEDIGEIAAVQVDWETDAAAVTTRGGAHDVAALMQRRTVTTGCGQGTMFGDLLHSVEQARLPEAGRLACSTLLRLLDNVRQHDSVYKQAGAVHGCALADGEGNILLFVEDVGRHNAVDAIAGTMWLEEITGTDKIFYTTGRLTSEMVIKAAQMGIPFLVSRSGLTQMGYEIAQRLGLTMIGRAHGGRYLLYTGEQRFVRDQLDA